MTEVIRISNVSRASVYSQRVVSGNLVTQFVEGGHDTDSRAGIVVNERAKHGSENIIMRLDVMWENTGSGHFHS